MRGGSPKSVGELWSISRVTTMPHKLGQRKIRMWALESRLSILSVRADNNEELF